MDEITIVSYYDDYSGDKPVNKTLSELHDIYKDESYSVYFCYDLGDYILFYINTYKNDNNLLKYKSDTYTLIFSFKGALLFVKNTVLPSSYSYYDNNIQLSRLMIISQNDYQRVQQFVYGHTEDNQCRFLNPDNYMKYINAKFHDTYPITNKIFSDPNLAFFQLAVILLVDFESYNNTVKHYKFDIVKNNNHFDLICEFNVGQSSVNSRGFIPLLQGDNRPLHGFFSNNYPADATYWLDTVLSQFKNFLTSEKLSVNSCFNLHVVQVISTRDIKPNIKFKFGSEESSTVYLDPPTRYCNGYGGIIEAEGRKCSKWKNISYTQPTSYVNICRPSGELAFVTEDQDINYNGTTYKCVNDNGNLTLISRNSCPVNKASIEWPETPAGTLVTRDCTNGYSYGTLQRYCNENAEWDEEQNNCYNIYCPSERYTWTNPVDTDMGLTTTHFPMTNTNHGINFDNRCPLGYTGEITRKCILINSNTRTAVWEDPVNNCTRITCPADNGFNQTNSEEIATKQCPAGYTGDIARLCNSDGTWGDPINNCTIKTCNANVSHGVSWPTSTYSTTPVSKPCPTGYTGEMTRVCGLNGWETVNSTVCQLKTCSANTSDGFSWSSTTYSLTPVSKSCPTGYTGTVYRTCTESGWSNIESGDCQVVEPEIPKCSVNISQGYTWPETNAGSSRSASCTGNYVGTMSRVCGSNGQWNNVNTSNCSIPECSANNGFNKTPAGETATKQCPTGYTGEMTRLCKSDGTWSDPSDNCTIKTCPANGGWSSTTYSLIPVSKSCPTGYTGEMTRVCGLNGWEAVDSTACQIKTCPANGGWSSTTYSLIPVSKSCPTGYTGEMTRLCRSDGTWSDPVDNCTIKTCPANGGWSSTTYSVTPVSKSCPTGYTGTMTRVCGLNGWETVNSTACQLVEEDVDDSDSGSSGSGLTSSTGSNIYCVADGDWPETLASSTAEIKCNSNSDSMMTRYCKVDGTWDEPVKTACEESSNTMLYVWIIVGVVIIIVVLYFIFGRSRQQMMNPYSPRMMYG